MFKNLRADAYFDNITLITAEYLKERDIKGIILDIDNTLIGHNIPMPDEKISTAVQNHCKNQTAVHLLFLHRQNQTLPP